MRFDSTEAAGGLQLAALPALLAAAAVLLLSACSRGASSGELTVAGSTSIQPFCDRWAEVYMEDHAGCAVNVQGGGSSAGIQAARSGAAHIGMSSRPLKPEEEDLVEIVVARDGLAIIVHPENVLESLSLQEVRAVFEGSVRSWSVLGGPAKPVHVITREEGSGTRGAFQELVMGDSRIFRGAIVQDSNGTVREIVAGDPNAVGYISLGLVDDRVRALKLDGVEATEESIESGAYPLVRPFLFVAREAPRDRAGNFLDFVLSEEGQALIKKEGLIPVRRRTP
ncbi:MAG: phosphate ABC transporter substrate-binding protein [Candidatus Aminicenantes bacterium]|nr:phosphate ABC transporter substrate-binding protein [Candidatus Aminicenantes bacterium]